MVIVRCSLVVLGSMLAKVYNRLPCASIATPFRFACSLIFHEPANITDALGQVRLGSVNDIINEPQSGLKLISLYSS